MISESLKTNTTLTALNLFGDENEVNEQTNKQQNKNKQETRIKKERKQRNE